MNNADKRTLLELLKQYRVSQQRDFVNGISKFSIGFTTNIKHDNKRNILVSILLENPKQHGAFSQKILNVIYNALHKALPSLQIVQAENVIIITKSKQNSFQDIAGVLKRIVKRINYIS